tara:strand:- start:110 stop:319 length:210 start_codon:yes stop_codon:yes gene_type:complete
MLIDRIDKEYKGYFITIKTYHSLKELIIYSNCCDYQFCNDKFLFHKDKFIDYSENEILRQAKKLIENSK